MTDAQPQSLKAAPYPIYSWSEEIATDLFGSFLSANAAFLGQRPRVAANTVLVSLEYLGKINAAPFDLVADGAFGGLRIIVAEMGVPFLLAYIPIANARAAQAG